MLVRMSTPIRADLASAWPPRHMDEMMSVQPREAAETQMGNAGYFRNMKRPNREVYEDICTMKSSMGKDDLEIRDHSST